MKVFIWERLEQATGNYHSEGGVMVVAESVERAKEMVSLDRRYFLEIIKTVTLMKNTQQTKFEK